MNPMSLVGTDFKWNFPNQTLSGLRRNTANVERFSQANSVGSREAAELTPADGTWFGMVSWRANADKSQSIRMKFRLYAIR